MPLCDNLEGERRNEDFGEEKDLLAGLASDDDDDAAALRSSGSC